MSTQEQVAARELLRTRVRFLDGKIEEVQVALQVERGTRAAHGEEFRERPVLAIEHDRALARRVGPMIRRMREADDVLRELTSPRARRRLDETDSQTRELMRQADRFLQLSERLMIEWRANPAFAYDEINAGWFTRHVREFGERGTFSVGGGYAAPLVPVRAPGPIQWYHWLLGGVALAGVGYVGLKVGWFVFKMTPQGQVVSKVTGTAGGVARKAVEAGTKAGASTAQKLVAASHLLTEKKESKE